MDYKAEISSWAWRFKRAGITQEDMAAKAEISLGALNRIIKGKTRNPTIETVHAVSEKLAALEKEAGISDTQ